MKRFLNKGNYSLLLDSIDKGENVSVFGLNIGEKLALVEDSAFLFYVVESIDKVNDVFDRLISIGRSCEVLTDYINPLTSEFLSCEKFLKILSLLKNNSIDTLIITPEVLTSRFPNKQDMIQMHLNIGDDINLTQLVKTLIENQYKRVDFQLQALWSKC